MGKKCGVANSKENYDKQAEVKVYTLSRNLQKKDKDGSPLYLETINIPGTKKKQFYVKNIGLKTTLQNQAMTRKDQEMLPLYLHALHHKPSQVPTLKKDCQSIGRSKEFIS